jgi:hypothetical protein
MLKEMVETGERYPGVRGKIECYSIVQSWYHADAIPPLAETWRH